MPSFNTDPNNFVDLNDYFSEINDKVGLSSEQFKLLVENTYYLLNHLGLADVEVGTITTQYGEPGTLADVLVTHREETVAGHTTDYFDYVFTIPSAEVTASASATVSSGTAAAVTTTTTPIKNNNVTVGYNIDFGFEIPRGPKGDQGNTPYIVNGFWWIGSTNTGIQAKGGEWFTGSSITPADGMDGDLFLNDDGEIYEKTNGAWVLYTSIKGPKGDRGDTTVTIDGVTASTVAFSSDPQTQINSKLNKNFGSANEGKILSIDSSGEVVATTSTAEDDVIDAYVVGSEYTSTWLSATSGGAPLTPEAGKIYIIRSAGIYFARTYIWNAPSYIAIGADPYIADNSITYNMLSTQVQNKLDDVENKVDYSDMHELSDQEIDDIFDEE